MSAACLRTPVNKTMKTMTGRDSFVLEALMHIRYGISVVAWILLIRLAFIYLQAIAQRVLCALS